MKKTITAACVAIMLTGCSQDNAQEKTQKGLDALSRSDYRAATIEFKSALQQDNENIEARIGLIDVLINERKINEAITELEIASAANINDNQKQRIEKRLAYVFFEQQSRKIDALPLTDMVIFLKASLGHDVDSLSPKATYNTPELYKRLLSMKDGSIDTKQAFETVEGDFIDKALSYLAIAERASLDNDIEMTVDAMNKYLSVFPSDAPRQLRLVDLLVSAQRYDEAKKISDKLYSKNKQHSLLNELMGIIALEQKRYEDALSLSLVPIANNPNNPRARITSALSEVALGRSDNAFEHLSFIINTVPSNSPLHALYTDIMIGKGNVSGAAEWALKTTPNKGPIVDSLANSALSLQNLGHYALSKRVYDHIIKHAEEPSIRLGVLGLSLNDSNGIRILNEMREQDPSSALLQQTVAAAYLASGDIAQAETLAKEWMSTRGENDTEANMLLAVSASRKGEYNSAIEKFLFVTKNNPDHVMAKAGLVEVYAITGESDKAWDIINQDADKEAGGILLRHYAGAMMGKQKNEALLNDLSGIAGGALAAPAKMISAQVHFISKQYEKGMALLTATDAPVSEPGYWFLKTMTTQAIGSEKDTFSAYQEWLQAEPASKYALTGLVSAMRSKGDIDGAIKQLQKSKSEHKDSRAIDLMIAELLTVKKDWVSLIDHVGKMQSSMKNTPIVAKLEGVALASLFRYAEAESRLKLAFNVMLDEETMRYLVASQEKQGAFDRAKQTLQTFSTANPNNPIGFMLLGNNRGMANDWRASMLAFKRAVNMGASDPLLLNNYAYSLMRTGDLISAQKYAQEAMKVSPENLQIADTLASIYLAQNDPESAYKTLYPFWSKGMIVSPGIIETYRNALVLSGREKEALSLPKQI